VTKVGIPGDIRDKWQIYNVAVGPRLRDLALINLLLSRHNEQMHSRPRKIHLSLSHSLDGFSVLGERGRSFDVTRRRRVYVCV
jgi:hypothetical protein